MPAVRGAPWDPALLEDIGEGCGRSDADTRESTGLNACGESASSSFFVGDAPLSESPVSCPLPSLPRPLLNCPLIEPIFSEPTRGFGLRASGVRLLELLDSLLPGAPALFAAFKPPVRDCLGCRAAGRAAEVCPPAKLGRGLTVLADVVVPGGFLTVAPVRLIVVVEVVEASCFVGDLVGDCKI